MISEYTVSPIILKHTDRQPQFVLGVTLQNARYSFQVLLDLFEIPIYTAWEDNLYYYLKEEAFLLKFEQLFLGITLFLILKENLKLEMSRTCNFRLLSVVQNN